MSNNSKIKFQLYLKYISPLKTFFGQTRSILTLKLCTFFCSQIFVVVTNTSGTRTTSNKRLPFRPARTI